MAESTLRLHSQHSLRQIPYVENESRVPARELSLEEIWRYGVNYRNFPQEIQKWKIGNFPHLWRGLKRAIAARLLGIGYLHGQWCLRLLDYENGKAVDYGLISLRVITNTGANYVVDAFQGLVGLSSFRYHGIGSGSNPESVNDTALVTEAATLYSTANTRPTGTLQEGVATNIFRTISFINVTDNITITEMGIFSQASTNSGSPVGGYLLDRALVSTITAFAAFTIQSDYRLTVATGS